MAEEATTHVLMFPFPAQGHVPPMLKLAELISAAGIFITFLNTVHVHGRFRSSAMNRLAQLPKFRLRTIPDGLPDDDPRQIHRLLDIEESMRTRSRDAFRELLRSMMTGRDPECWPPVTCVVADGILPLALDVAEEFGIPVMILRTSSACSLWAYCCIPQLIERGEIPFPDGADVDKLIQGVAGMEEFLRYRDLPSLIRNAKSPDDRGIQFANTFSNNLSRARALILNTFDSLESPVLAQIRSVCPITYSIGPVHLLAKNLSPDDLSSESTSFWPEDRTCITWLDTQPSKSVVYVSFGSSLIMSQDELIELWHGLRNSGQRFLWVVRPDLIELQEHDVMLELKMEDTRGCLVSWAPQEEVLAHRAVGCFLTHSGWNSTMESVAAGVPMICRPFFVDQLINSRFVSEVWKIGVDMKDLRGRDVVERMIREVMQGEKAEELRMSCRDVQIAAVRSVEGRGTSCVDLGNLIEHIKSLHSQTPCVTERSN